MNSSLITLIWRRRLCLLVTALCLVSSQSWASTESVDQQLARIALMPSKENAKALAMLTELRKTVAAQDPQALEVIWQLASIHTAQRNTEAVMALEPSFASWTNDPARNRAAMGRVAWQLVLYRLHLFKDSTHDAREALAALQLSEEEKQSLPPMWRLRLSSSRAANAEESGKFDDALVFRLEAYRAAAESGEPRRVAGAMSGLAALYRRKADLDEARHWLDQALAIANAQSQPDDVLLSDLYVNLGTIQTDQERYAEAAESYKKALDIAVRDHDDSMRALMLGNLADLGLRTKDYPRALRLASEALALATETKDRASQNLAKHNMGVAKIAMGRLAEGRALVLEAIDAEREAGHVTSVAEGLVELGDYLERAGDLQGAMKAYAEYRGLADNLEREERRKAVLEAQQQLNDDRLSAERENLVKANELNSAKAEARRLQLALWTLLLACGAAAVALLVKLSRRTREANQALAKSNEVLAEQSERDPLTGLGNRHLLQRLLAEPKRASGSVGSLFLVDVDHFKQINDMHGHAGGDQVLIEMAERLRAAVRDGDAVVRWGGEEFLVLTNTQDASAAQALAQRVLNSIAQTPVSLSTGAKVQVSVSMGFARFPLPEVEGVLPWELALELVDQLMYRAKSHGRNQAWSLESARNARADELLALLADAEAAIQRGALELGQWRGPSLTAGAAA